MACSKAHLYDPALKENQDPVLMKLQSQVKKVVFKLPELGAEHAGLPSQDFEAADVARILYRAGRADPCLQYETEADQLLLLMHLILKHFADSEHIEVVKQAQCMCDVSGTPGIMQAWLSIGVISQGHVLPHLQDGSVA
jgi:hypothetical protein